MKLTAAIAHSYPNAEVRFMDIDNIDKVAKMDGIVKDTVHLGIPCNLISLPIEHKFISVEYCQLILTPLDKISDEDAVEVAKIMYDNNGESDYGEVTVKERVDEAIELKGEYTEVSAIIGFDCSLVFFNNAEIVISGDPSDSAIPTIRQQSAIDYLRSKGYDCGHGSIPNLIAAGVAVEKEQI